MQNLLIAILQRLVITPDSALKNGIHVVAGPGTGKSRLLALLIAWLLLWRMKSQVIIDPTGGVVDNIIAKIARQPLPIRRRIWPRIHYVDWGASDYVVPSPLYYRQSQADTTFEIANRFLTVLKRQDPQLQSAPILGWNSLYECGLYAGQIAVALDAQIDFVADLVRDPRQYKDLLKQALMVDPKLKPAVTYFRELMDPKSGALRSRRTDSFRNKLLPLQSDPTMFATFAAPRRGIDWEQIDRSGHTVLIDARDERDADRRQFKLLWWFRDFVDYIKYRGMTGRGREIGFLIDEVTQLLGYRTAEGQSLLAEDLEELTSVLGRNFGVNSVISHQNMSQVDPRIQNVLMQMGTQCVGVLTNDDDALLMARVLHRYNPSMVRKREPVWMSVREDVWPYTDFVPEIIDYTTTEFTPDEQVRLAADTLRGLPKFTFLIRNATEEGNLSTRVQRVSIANVDRNQYPDPHQVNEIRSYLRVKSGISVDEVTSLIEQEREKRLMGSRRKRSDDNAILNEGGEQHEKSQERSDFSTQTRPNQAEAGESFKEELWTQK